MRGRLALILLLTVTVSCGQSSSDAGDTVASTVRSSTSNVPDTTAVMSTDPPSTLATATAAPDLSAIKGLVQALSQQSVVGGSTLSIALIRRAVPRASIDGYFDSGDVVVVGVPAGASCAWFVGAADGTVMLGETDDPTCDPSAGPPQTSLDGGGVAWSNDALGVIDTIAQANATMVFEVVQRALIGDGYTPTIADVQEILPGLVVVAGDDESTSANTVSMSLVGTSLAVAVLGQSGTCYVLSAEITGNSSRTYGVSDVCNATAAKASAASPSW